MPFGTRFGRADNATPAPLRSRNVAAEQRPPDGGVEGFDTEDARAINQARLEHLGSLGLPLTGRRVLDVGSGPGHLAQFFVERGCTVVSTDTREENIARMKELYPGHDGRVADVETDDVASLGSFDVVFCYGLLYHLENPVRALRNLVAACDDLLLIETMLVDSPLAVLRLEDEYLSANQAVLGIAHRPSSAWLAMALDRIGMSSVYAAAEPPAHPDYRWLRRGDLSTERDGHLLRGVFVASRHPLDLETLVPLVSQPE
jgi:SAM-dependent methyltransferase